MSAVAIFVKTPGLSPLKTRLARSLGQERTLAIYRHSAAAVAAVAEAANTGPVYWAVAEPARQARRLWRGLPLIEQGRGGLGERMHHVHGELLANHGSAILLGADTPQLDPYDLSRAAAWLDESDPRQVIAPARDGGFWLYGSNSNAPTETWRQVPYSRSDTMSRFVRSMTPYGEWLTLNTLTDLDTAEDLEPVSIELARVRNPVPAQRRLLEELEKQQEENIGRKSRVRSLKPEIRKS